MTKKSGITWDVSSIKTYLSLLLDTSYFEPDGRGSPAIRAQWDEGTSPLVLITGPNASGKSFLRRLVNQSLRKAEVECIHLSQEGRSASGIIRSMVYGTEEWQATGEITTHSILMAFKTARGRNNKHAIFFDEPEIGLSDEYAAGAGKEIAEFIAALPPLTFAVFVVTHSKHLARELVHLGPHHLRLGDSPCLEDWLNKPVVPRDLRELEEESRKRYKRIQAILARK